MSEDFAALSCLTLAEQLCKAGLDIVHPFAADRELDPIFPLERFGQERAQGLLVGNTRALWPHLLGWFRQHPGEPHPVQTYVGNALSHAMNAAFAALGAPPPRQQLYLPHRLDYVGNSGLSAVPFQRLAQAVGFAAVGPAHLSAHAVFGPWFAFRAVWVLDLAAYSPQATVAQAPCATCRAPCQDVLLEVLESAGQGTPIPWERWLAVRDACPVGRDHRYCESQLKYHYTKARRWLKSEIATNGPPPHGRA